MSKITIIAILAWSSMFTDLDLSKVDIASNQLIVNYGKSVQKQGLHLAGVGGSIDHKTGKIKKFIAPFGIDHMMTVAEARIRFVTLVEEFLNFANAQEGVREHLSCHPITVATLKLSIVCERSIPGEIAHVSHSRNVIYYYQRVDDSRFSQEKSTKKRMKRLKRL